MLFTGCSVLAGEGTLIIKASHKGKHHGCILIHGAVGRGRISNAECSQQDCCGECESHSLWIRGQTNFIRWCDFIAVSLQLAVQACLLVSFPVSWIRLPGVCLCSGPCPTVAGFVVNLPSLWGRVFSSVCQCVPAFSCHVRLVSWLQTSVLTLLDFVAFRLTGFDLCLCYTELDLPAESAFWVQTPPP